MTDHIQGHINAYVDLINSDVSAISEQMSQLNLLSMTTDPTIVHTVLEELVSYQLQTEWARVPRQYQHKDWYLLAMHRFLTFANGQMYDLLTPTDREELTMVFTQLQVPGVFQFIENPDGTVYFVEMGTKQKLFFWSIQDKQLYFNSHALTSLLVSNYRAKDTADDIRTVSDLLRTFGRYMAQTFGYDVDYNILETDDNYRYELVQTEMPAGMLDRLFVLSAESNYFLQTVQNGAAMMLENGVEMRVFYDENPQAIAGQEWHFQVLDGHHAVSWLDVLLDYDFIGTWYLKERKTIEVASKQAVFDDNMRRVRRPQVIVEVLYPKESVADAD
ncbi:hypothetical protein H9L19_04990 [Weissella diestrammenae]|uniref:Uncharacterized protein n=1 Tax=Weissella diestrammenae TaxID=1162633 RepID=A0A7G9T3U8_9LACO|nr:hypothetical protein [Weissella diestrammenae]MCM0582761.1 hypothetical protein [Weissella diestrammenae]QNN74773.1 hypothetical protein H9L19_04990 [Weissella diestrammenae]